MNRLAALVSGWMVVSLLAAWAGVCAAQPVERTVQAPGGSRPSYRQVSPVADPKVIDGSVPRVALVVGNAAYSHQPRLDNPVRDAHAVCARFKQLGFDAECIENARTRRDMRAAIIRFADKIKPGAVALFYFAGHGVQKRGENFLLPVDARIDRVADVDEEGLPLGYLMEVISEVKPALNLVLIDACRDNLVDKARELSLPRGFAAIDAPANTAVFYSTAPGRVAFDRAPGDAKGLSPFATEVLKRLADESASLEALFKGVIAGVQSATAGRQVPWVNSSFSGTFCFGPCAAQTLPSEMARIAEEKDEVEARLRQVEADRDRRETELAKLSSRVRELEGMTQARQKELDGLRESGRQTSSSFSDQNRQLQQELEVLRQANQKLSDERAALSTQKQEAQRLETVSQELSAKLKQIEQLKSDNAKLRQKADDLNKEINALQAQERVGTRQVQPERPKPPPPPAF